MEIAVAGADPGDTVLPHQDGRMRVVEQIAGEVWHLGDELGGNVSVSKGGDENGKPWRGKERGHELPGYSQAPRPAHDARVRRHAQKLVQDRPGGVPGIGPRALSLQPVPTGGMKLGVGV